MLIIAYSLDAFLLLDTHSNDSIGVLFSVRTKGVAKREKYFIVKLKYYNVNTFSMKIKDGTEIKENQLYTMNANNSSNK